MSGPHWRSGRLTRWMGADASHDASQESLPGSNVPHSVYTLRARNCTDTYRAYGAYNLVTDF